MKVAPSEQDRRNPLLSLLIGAILLGGCSGRTAIATGDPLPTSPPPSAPVLGTVCPADEQPQHLYEVMLVYHLAVDEKHVYAYASGEGVFRIPLDGGVSEPLLQNGNSLAIDDTNVYTTNGESLVAVNKATRVSRVLAAAPYTALATDAGQVFFNSASAIRRVAREGGAAVDIAPIAGEVPEIHARDGFVYWLEAQAGSSAPNIRRAPVGGGEPEIIAQPSTLTEVRSFAIDAWSVYWSDADSVRASPREGGPIRELAPHRYYHEYDHLAVDTSNVFVSTLTQGGWIQRIPVAGGEAFVLSDGGSYAIALDESYVYWASASAGIRRRSKCASSTP
jgi:hypothetical protein